MAWAWLDRRNINVTTGLRRTVQISQASCESIQSSNINIPLLFLWNGKDHLFSSSDGLIFCVYSSVKSVFMLLLYITVHENPAGAAFVRVQTRQSFLIWKIGNLFFCQLLFQFTSKNGIVWFYLLLCIISSLELNRVKELKWTSLNGNFRSRAG